MSKIQLTLTADQFKQIDQYNTGYDLQKYSYISEQSQYFISNPLVVTFDVPTPWRTDIANAPKDETAVLVMETSSPNPKIAYYFVVLQKWYIGDYPVAEANITNWMLIPSVV